MGTNNNKKVLPVTTVKKPTTKKVLPVVKKTVKTPTPPTNVIKINKLFKSGNVITKYTLVQSSVLTSGNIINNLGVKTSLKGFTNYVFTNPTILQHRNIINVNVYINKMGVTVITCTRKTKNGNNTVLYNHLPQKLVLQLQNNHSTKVNYLKPIITK